MRECCNVAPSCSWSPDSRSGMLADTWSRSTTISVSRMEFLRPSASTFMRASACNACNALLRCMARRPAAQPAAFAFRVSATDATTLAEHCLPLSATPLAEVSTSRQHGAARCTAGKSSAPAQTKLRVIRACKRSGRRSLMPQVMLSKVTSVPKGGGSGEEQLRSVAVPVKTAFSSAEP